MQNSEDYKGPKISSTKRNFTTRDSLGIDGVATSISNYVCPIVTTVTPRPYFWAFVMWCYYDYYNNVSKENRTKSNVYKYIKKNNYFIALGSILTGRTEINTYPGIDHISRDLDPYKSEYTYNENYIVNIGNIGYYPAGLISMGLLADHDENTLEVFKQPKIRPEGVRLAKAFDKVFSETEYYKYYRLNTKSVPRSVLIELGNTMSVSLDGFDECKEVLKHNLFERESNLKLIQSKNYVNYIHEQLHEDLRNTAKCREVLFDVFSKCGENHEIDDSLKQIANEWEVVIARMYFTTGLKIIWQYMIQQLNKPMTENEWLEDCFNNQVFYDDNATVGDIISEQYYTFEEREQIINSERLQPGKNSLANGLRIILSVYNRLDRRNDFSEKTKSFYYDGARRDSISLAEFFNCVEDYFDRPAKELMIYIMKNYLILQHLKTAFGKMLENRDGFYIEVIGNKIVRKEVFDFDFQGIRLNQLYRVMLDLGMLS